MAGYADHKTDVLHRLNRIEGQVRGLKRLVEEDRYCVDVLTQIAAATKALQAVGLELIDDHLSHCVAEAVAAGGETAQERVAEAVTAITRLVRA